LLEHAPHTGGPALRELTFGEHGEMLRRLSRVLRENRDGLLALCRANMGLTRGDGAVVWMAAPRTPCSLASITRAQFS
jgi:hypothetical protein